MPSIFSTYSQGENRVTGTFISLLRTLPVDDMQQLIALLLEEPELKLFSIGNQPRERYSVPDAEISGDFKILIETKLRPGEVRVDQLKRHLQLLPGQSQSTTARLILLTPDTANPLPEGLRTNVRWVSFDDLVQAMEELMEENPLSETNRFLLRHFQEFLKEEGLLRAPGNRVLVVPARQAWDEYRRCGAYVCQDKRSFQPSARLAFYTNGAIQPQIPKILAAFDSVFFPEEAKPFTSEEHVLASRVPQTDEERVALERAIHVWGKIRGEAGRCFKVFLLSPFIHDAAAAPGREHSGTWLLPNSVEHRPEGRMTAYVRRQRYVDFESLKTAATTGELKGA